MYIINYNIVVFTLLWVPNSSIALLIYNILLNNKIFFTSLSTLIRYLNKYLFIVYIN